MSKSTKKTVRHNVIVEIHFDPPIGPTPQKHYDKLSQRCEKLDKLLKPINLGYISFKNPYSYGYTSVKRRVIEVDKKAYLPAKKREQLSKLLSSTKAKKLGVKSFRIRTVKETTTVVREFGEEWDRK